MKTVKPTENQLEMAIVAAEQLLDSGLDLLLAGTPVYFERVLRFAQVALIAGLFCIHRPF
jgi:hypothetical protein